VTHLAFPPGKRWALQENAAANGFESLRYAARCAASGFGAAEPCVDTLPQDRRFLGKAWQNWPFNLIHQNFLLSQKWWHSATTGVGGVTRQSEAAVEFAARQLLDMVSPSNFLLTNPEVLGKTLATGGTNL